MSSFITIFQDISKNDVRIAGGKGASLGEMTQAGIPVPPGFVVTAQSFDEFLKATDLNVELDAILDSVDHAAMHTVDDASEKINALILGADIPEGIAAEIQQAHRDLSAEFVAVRSSATSEDSADAAWAGQLESYLNITADNLLESVQKCWASLFTPRAIFYRFEKGLHDKPISVAVVIQQMVASEVSGIAFSVHPVTQDYDQLIIEAGFGLGEAIVSGSITPDSYVVEKSEWRIIDKNIITQEKGMFRGKDGGSEWEEITKVAGEKPTLSDEEVIELARLVVKIEKHYGFPVDVEWAKKNRKFFIVQSRPITTLSNSGKITVSTDNHEFDPENYVRMFAGKSFVYILTDIFLQHYNSLGVLSIQDEESWLSFLPKTVQERTLKEGKKLYTSKKLYREYYEEFHEFMRSSTKYFNELLSQEEVNQKDVRHFFELIATHFSFYAKTEFFYTDSLDQESMVITIKEFEKLKLDGRAYLNKIIFEENGFIRTLLKKLSRQTGVPTSDLSHYGIDEIIALVQDGKKVLVSSLKEREVFFASAGHTVFGEKARLLVDAFLSTYRGISDIIRGTIANTGKVTGRARVLIPDYRDFDKIAVGVREMQQGEVLVAETTSPEIIQACKKASAIITNQGGRLSHAAIISRELGIPCIIGTDKDVILNIKTGDEVEVDADQGLVRILKKK